MSRDLKRLHQAIGRLEVSTGRYSKRLLEIQRYHTVRDVATTPKLRDEYNLLYTCLIQDLWSLDVMRAMVNTTV